MSSEVAFNASHFVSSGHENDSGDWRDDDRALIHCIRNLLPELAVWGDLPIGVAWGSYSQDVWLVGWLEVDPCAMDRERLIPFLAYIHYHETHGEPPSWGISIDELDDYAIEHKIKSAT